MKIIKFIPAKSQILGREISFSPETDIKKQDSFDLGFYYLAHSNGEDYIQLSESDLMYMLQFLYVLEEFDLTEDTLADTLDINMGLFFSATKNGSTELCQFFYKDTFIKSLNDLLELYADGIFNHGYNSNVVRAR